MHQRGVHLRELLLVVGIGDVHRPQVFGCETRQALLANRQTELLDGVQVGHLGEDLFFLGVDGVEGELFGIEEAEDVVMEIQQDLIHLAGRMNLVGNTLD